MGHHRQQVGSCKPSRRSFEVTIERIGVPREQILHVSQGLLHDRIVEEPPAG